MARQSGYASELNRKQTVQLRELISGLPKFCEPYFRSIEERTQVRTRLAYALDLRVFFSWLVADRPNADVSDVSLDDLRAIRAVNLEEYQSYLTLYESNGTAAVRENSATGKERKLSSLRSLFRYLYKSEELAENVALLVELPKKRGHEIVRLEPDEVAKMLDMAESGEAMSSHQQKFHQKTQVRDMAILTLLLGTGVRVSECVGLNIEDINLAQAAMVVTRKGGDRVVLYLSDEVIEALNAWLSQRGDIVAMEGHQSALFLSLQKKRITPLAVQNLVKKYARPAAPLKRITPHKLRSTFGTTLYQETGDIYLVADVLGHSDVNTTRKHYADIVDDHRRTAARVVRLRDPKKPKSEDE